MFGGPAALFDRRAGASADARRMFSRAPAFDTLIATTLLSFFAIILLPRQFHVAVVENHNEGEIKRAAWLFPLYLVLINLFVVPIALAGLLTFRTGEVDSDMFVLALPLQTGSSVLAIAAFVGGLSAATAMVIVESVALSIMVSNDIVMPLVLRRRGALISGRENVGSLLLTVRRRGDLRHPPARLSVLPLGGRRAARLDRPACRSPRIAQLAPAFFGGLIWRRATGGGAIAGMIAGIAGLGLHAAAAELRRHRHHRPAHPDRRARSAHRGAAAAASVRARPAAAGARRDLEPGGQHRLLISACRCGASRRRSSGCRPILFVPTRAGADRAELPALALLGDGRGADRDGRALSRRGAHAQRLRELRRHPPHQPRAARTRPTSGWCATPSIFWPRRSARASSRLVLSLLLRKRTVSTKAALKLLDDANAAIQYNREILQTALDHVRQGIAVFDKDLQLICWNRQFGEILDLPPSLIRVGIGLAEILRFNAGAATSRPSASTNSCTQQIERYVSGSEPFLRALRRARPGRSRCAPTACRTAASSPPSPTSRRASKPPKRWSAPTRRWSGACTSAPRS